MGRHAEELVGRSIADRLRARDQRLPGRAARQREVAYGVLAGGRLPCSLDTGRQPGYSGLSGPATRLHDVAAGLCRPGRLAGDRADHALAARSACRAAASVRHWPVSFAQASAGSCRLGDRSPARRRAERCGGRRVPHEVSARVSAVSAHRPVRCRSRRPPSSGQRRLPSLSPARRRSVRLPSRPSEAHGR